MLDECRLSDCMNEDVAALIQLLSDECGWPIDPEMVNRSAWKLNHDELGLNDEVDIGVEVYELRPLVTKQPWGVFFLSVDGKSRLSVTLLRRLLRGLVKKKRATAEAASRKLWDLDDLMFVCSLEEPDNITRYFAHFKETEKGLPKLMIGARWEDAQDGSEIQKEINKLRNNLHWPDDETNIDAWKSQWNVGFQVGHREVIKDSVALSKALAKLAVVIKENIPEIHRIERENGPIHTLYQAFREALVKDLKLSAFADMVAQTITYGLFSARATGTVLSGIETLSESIPSTNPFLRNLFSEFASLGGDKPTDLDFDDLCLDELVTMLNSINIDAVMGDFGNQFKGGKEDPVIHLYETFLADYDSELRFDRGVFYTPKPIVRYMVKNVHEKLIADFNIPLGLADTSTHLVNGNLWHRVTILDPATGTGTFLEEVIYLIHETMISSWKDSGKSHSELSGLWTSYVEDHLLKKIFGFELMMAPYAIAHLKLGLALIRTGYVNQEKHRLGVFLTNTIEGPKPLANWLPEFLSQEASSAAAIKEDAPITVVIGNPPYSGESSNDNVWINDLMRTELSDGADSYFRVDGKGLGERNPKWINDDYVKFIRYSQYRICNSGIGISCMITPHGYLDNPTFRGVRQSLMTTYNSISILDLHGNTRKGETAPDGSPDKNVFDIQQGVCITTMSLVDPNDDAPCQVERFDIFGTREKKYSALKKFNANEFETKKLTPIGNFYLFSEFDEEDWKEYSSWPSITQVFPLHSAGITSARDSFSIDINEDVLYERISQFINMNSEDARTKFSLGKDVRDWKVSLAQQDARNNGLSRKYIQRIQYRIWDWRSGYYTGTTRGIMCMPRRNVMREMINGDNIGLITVRRKPSGKESVYFWVSDCMIMNGTIRSDSQSIDYLFPLYRFNNGKRICTIPKSFIGFLSKKIGMKFLEVGTGDIIENFGPEDVLNYCYAIFHSKEYRTRFSEFMENDFPRIPFCTDSELFRELCHQGKRLSTIHRNPARAAEKSGVTFFDAGNRLVTRAGETGKKLAESKDGIGKLFINSSSYFDSVPTSVWNKVIGTYQVCHKWMSEKKRNNVVLTVDDEKLFISMINAILETEETQHQIDGIINKHGGWPLKGSSEFIFNEDIDPNQMRLDLF
jgi:predicted helicase